MGQVRDVADQLYQGGALLGFSISSVEGEMVHNESFFSDEFAIQAMGYLSDCVQQLMASGRQVERLTVEMDDVVVIFTPITDRDRRGMFIFSRECDLDSCAALLSQLAA